jgi:hypothetical protein
VRPLALAAALLAALAVLAGCGSGKPAMKSVQLQVTGGNQGPYEYILTINNSGWWDTTGNLPWTSNTTLLKAGSQVSFSLWTTPFDTTGPVTWGCLGPPDSLIMPLG